MDDNVRKKLSLNLNLIKSKDFNKSDIESNPQHTKSFLNNYVKSYNSEDCKDDDLANNKSNSLIKEDLVVTYQKSELNINSLSNKSYSLKNIIEKNLTSKVIETIC